VEMAITLKEIENEAMQRIRSLLDGRPNPDADEVYSLIGEILRQLRQEHPNVPGQSYSDIWRKMWIKLNPKGPLVEYLDDESIEEIRFNGPSICYIVQDGKRLRIDSPIQNEKELWELIEFYLGDAGGRLDRASPMVTATLSDGSRMHAVLSPPARPMSVTIRKHLTNRFTSLSDIVAVGSLHPSLIPFLQASVRARANMLIAGGTSCGKTTFIRLLAKAIPRQERVVTIEDQAELQLWKFLDDCISLECRNSNTEGRGEINIRMLVHEALRMSPDRIIIGEVRGPEALDLLDAWNTGHPGSFCTIHSDNPRDTIPRLLRLVMRGLTTSHMEIIMDELSRSLDIVIHLGVMRIGSQRRRILTSIGVVTGMEAGKIVVEELVKYDWEAQKWKLGQAFLEAMPLRLISKFNNAGEDLKAIFAELKDGLRDAG